MPPTAAAAGNLSALPAERMGPLSLRLLPLAGEGLSFSVLHETLPPGAETPAVTHRRTRELVLVVAGSGRAEIGSRRVALRKGDWLVIPPGEPHVFRAGEGGLEAYSFFDPALDPGAPDVVLSGGRRPSAAAKLLRAAAPRRHRGRGRKGSPLGGCY